MVELDRRVDLVAEVLVVAECEPDLKLARASPGGHLLDRAEITMGVDDLPNIQCGPDHPGPTVPVVASKGDPGEHPCPQRFIGKRLDNDSSAPLAPPRFGIDQFGRALG